MSICCVLQHRGCRTNVGVPTRTFLLLVSGEFGVAVNVRCGDVDQLMLMPPSVREWLPEDHLAFFVLDMVAELDLAEFCAAHRADGRGGSVYHPATMLAVLLYALLHR